MSILPKKSPIQCRRGPALTTHPSMAPKRAPRIEIRQPEEEFDETPRSKDRGPWRCLFCETEMRTSEDADTCEECCELRDEVGENLRWSCCALVSNPNTGATQRCGTSNKPDDVKCAVCDHDKCDTCTKAESDEGQEQLDRLEKEISK